MIATLLLAATLAAPIEVRPADSPIRIEVSEGDMIVIPANTFHRFYLTDAKHIRCMRLFANNEGWAPLYREA